MKLKGSFFVIIMLLAVVANAQVPRVISYQGVLTASPGGSPVNGMRNLGFALYESEDDFATPIWTETHLGVHVQHGVFAVYLGSATPFPSSVDFSKQYWLGISIDGGAELTPRYHLTASPYAMNIPSMGAEDGQVLKWNATSEKWEPSDDDFGCFELSSDSTERDQGCVPWYLENNVIYTATGDPKECKPQVLGISKGAVNSLQGSDSLETHVNLGVNCTTGTSRTYIVYPTISGGKGNTANSNFSTIAGGKSNIVSGDSSVVSGGANNTVSGVNSAVPGGSGNTVSGNYSLAFGKDVEVDGNYQVAFFSDSIPGKLGVNSDSLIATLDIRGDAVFNANQDDHDFRIAGDSVENLFFVDASTNRIGIGTNTPGAEEHVSIFKGNIAVDNGINGLHTSLLASASDTFAAMVFRKNGTRHAGMRWDGSKLEIINASHSHYDPDLWRYGGPPLATFNIQQSKVGILTDSPAYELDVNGDVGISGNLDLSAGTEILDGNGDPAPGAGYVLMSDGGPGGPPIWEPFLSQECAIWVVDEVGEDARVLLTGYYQGNNECSENFLAVAKGDAGNDVLGPNRHTHVNLGAYSQTGVSEETDRIYCTISGGNSNVAEADYTTISGGVRNYALKNISTIAGGDSNVVNGDGGFIGGGLENHIEGNGVWGQYCVIAGGTQNSSAGNWTTIGGGFSNTIEGEYGTIGGGQSNTINEADHSALLSGLGNTISIDADESVISGGANNTISGASGFIGGGSNNYIVSGVFGTIGGGRNHVIDADYSFIGGGYADTILADSSVIAGGIANKIQAPVSFIGGGSNNLIAPAGTHSVIGGGFSNVDSASYSILGGGSLNRIKANASYSFLGGGNLNRIETNASYAFIGGGYLNTTKEEYAAILGGENNTVDGRAATISGGTSNSVIGYYSFIAGGYYNEVDGQHSSISGGYYNTVNANMAFIGGGEFNTASGVASSICGGSVNIATGDGSFIGAGGHNEVTGYSSVIGGGSYNATSGDFSAVVGGSFNSVSGFYSQAFGRKVVVPQSYVAAFFSDDSADGAYRGKLSVNEPNPTSTLHYDGSEASAWEEYTTDDGTYDMDTDDHTLFVDGNNITVTLPDPNPTTGDNCPGRIYYIKNTSDDDADSVDVDPSGAVSIDGQTNLYLYSMEGWIIQANDEDWWIIAKF